MKVCHNTNPIFDKYPIDSKEYTDELVTQISKSSLSTFEYCIEDYEAKNGKEYMLVRIQNDSVCAKMYLDVTNSNRMENFRKLKGKSYSGAELRGLTFQIQKDSSGHHFIFDDVKRIID
ncbi:MAG: hypothetical protein JST82_12785 [Bacteroidetes bacterium]|nr:hypothetical protein [Bacteroidota bacterium]